MRIFKRNNLLIASFILLLVTIPLVIKFLMDSQPIDTTSYTNVYSDGWYEYSFKYPPNAILSSSFGGINTDRVAEGAIIPHNSINIRTKPIGDKESNPCGIEVTLIGGIGDLEVKINKPSVKVSNGIQWRKQKYESEPGSLLYNYKGVVWQTEKDNFRYTLQSLEKDERWCESIISTFQFGVDSSVLSAQKAKAAKDTATQYISRKYPDMVFAEGNFLYDEKVQTLGLLDFSNKAEVIVSTSTQQNGNNSKGILLSEQDGVWVVSGEVDPR